VQSLLDSLKAKHGADEYVRSIVAACH